MREHSPNRHPGHPAGEAPLASPLRRGYPARAFESDLKETSSSLLTWAIWLNVIQPSFWGQSAQRRVAMLKSLVVPCCLTEQEHCLSPPLQKSTVVLLCPTFKGFSAVSVVSCLQTCLLLGMKWPAKGVVPYQICGIKWVSEKCRSPLSFHICRKCLTSFFFSPSRLITSVVQHCFLSFLSAQGICACTRVRSCFPLVPAMSMTLFTCSYYL